MSPRTIYSSTNPNFLTMQLCTSPSIYYDAQARSVKVFIFSFVLFWYFLISLSATVPGLKRWGFFTPPVAGADFLAALVVSCLHGALPPVDLRAVCFVRAIAELEPSSSFQYLKSRVCCLFWRDCLGGVRFYRVSEICGGMGKAINAVD